MQQSGLAWTIVRCGWFNQNFSENFIHDMVLGGAVALPPSEVREPFIDAEDIAGVAVDAFTEAGHDGQIYELTGPELITFPEAVATIAKAAGRDIAYQTISREAFIDGLTQQQLPQGLIGLLDDLFTNGLDGRNAYLADGVERALGRQPRSFTTYAEGVAAGGHRGIGRPHRQTSWFFRWERWRAHEKARLRGCRAFVFGSEAAATFDCGAELLALAPGARVPVGLPGGFGAPGTVQ